MSKRLTKKRNINKSQVKVNASTVKRRLTKKHKNHKSRKSQTKKTKLYKVHKGGKNVKGKKTVQKGGLVCTQGLDKTKCFIEKLKVMLKSRRKPEDPLFYYLHPFDNLILCLYLEIPITETSYNPGPNNIGTNAYKDISYYLGIENNNTHIKSISRTSSNQKNRWNFYDWIRIYYIFIFMNEKPEAIAKIVDRIMTLHFTNPEQTEFSKNTTGKLTPEETIFKENLLNDIDIELHKVSTSNQLSNQKNTITTIPHVSTGSITRGARPGAMKVRKALHHRAVDPHLSDKVCGRTVYNPSYDRYPDIGCCKDHAIKVNGYYINASMMAPITLDGKQHEIITAQCPNPDGISLFYEMLNEENVTRIIMVTNFKERKDGQYVDKCAEYFNNTANKTFPWGETRNQISYKPLQRTLSHIWFTGWPDHGVPENPELFKNFIDAIREDMKEDMKNNNDNDGKTVIHCSAGVGRTGVVYIVLKLLSLGKNYEQTLSFRELNDEINIARHYRNQHLVQANIQYEFIYNLFNRNKTKDTDKFLITRNFKAIDSLGEIDELSTNIPTTSILIYDDEEL